MDKINRSDSIYYLKQIKSALDTICDRDKRYISNGLGSVMEELRPIGIDVKNIKQVKDDIDELITKITMETTALELNIQNSMILGSFGIDVTECIWNKRLEGENDEVGIMLDPTSSPWGSSCRYVYNIDIKRPYGSIRYAARIDMRVDGFCDKIVQLISDCKAHAIKYFIGGTRDKQLITMNKETGYIITMRVNNTRRTYTNNIPFNSGISSIYFLKNLIKLWSLL
jgi:hypothetical protein